jgi:hypothetical protein
MNRQTRFDDNEDIRPEYDFSRGVRGKHHEASRAGTNVVFLDPDIAKVFRDSASVNRVLRLLLRLAQNSVPTRAQSDKARQPTRRPRGRGKARSRPA